MFMDDKFCCCGCIILIFLVFAGISLMGSSTHTSDDSDNEISNDAEMTLSDDDYENDDSTDSSEEDYDSDDEYDSGDSSKSDGYSSSSSESTYVGSSNSDKFHDPSCTYANKIKDENKSSFSSRDDAEKSGYHSCSYCNP